MPRPLRNFAGNNRGELPMISRQNEACPTGDSGQKADDGETFRALRRLLLNHEAGPGGLRYVHGLRDLLERSDDDLAAHVPVVAVSAT